MISLAEIPHKYREIGQKKLFLEFLRDLHAFENDKAELLFAWAKMVGAIITPQEQRHACKPFGTTHEL